MVVVHPPEKSRKKDVNASKNRTDSEHDANERPDSPIGDRSHDHNNKLMMPGSGDSLSPVVVADTLFAMIHGT